MSKSISLPLLTKETLSIKKKNLSIEDESSRNPLRVSLRTKLKKPHFLQATREWFRGESRESFEGPIGTKAKLNFINTYRKRIEITERNQYEKIEKSPTIAYLEVIDKHKMSPLPTGIVRNTGKETEVNLKGYCMGDNYALAFSEGLKHSKSIEKINLKSNYLSEKGSSSIIEKINTQSIKDLCLSNNKLGKQSIDKISELIKNSYCNLKHLSLEKVKLNDISGFIIFEALYNNQTITELNVSDNCLTEICAKTIKTALSKNKTLKKLNLHWNNFLGNGCTLIFQGLIENNSLLELDLSWNMMVRGLDLTKSSEISVVLSKQSRLMHLDLSSNYLTTEICKVLQEGLQHNHTLLGIHMTGNECVVDPRGFIIPNQNANRIEQSHFQSRILTDIKPKIHANNVNCWLCEKWVETTFHWTGEATEPIFIHFEIDDYQPELMAKGENSYFLTRVVPPGPVNFFFSKDLCFVKSKNYEKKKLPEPINKEVFFWDDYKDQVVITDVNFDVPAGIECKIKDPFLSKPRIPKKVYVPPPEGMVKIPWSFAVSLFKDYKVDDTLVLNECFEFDWTHSRIPNIIKDLKDLEKTKNYLRENYQIIKEAYKTMSSYSGSEIPSIGSNIFMEMLSICNIFDNQYAVSDFGVNWNSSIVPLVKGQDYNPGNALVRYEFLEIIVRVAFDRYVRTKSTFQLSESVKKLLKDHLLPHFRKISSDSWRTEKYFFEIIDVTLKAHRPIFDSVYKKYSGRKTLPGHKPFMSLEEFRQVCISAGMVNENFSTREIDLCFTQAMMTQVDELFKKRHIEMSFVEFLEAICRAIDLTDTNKSEANEFVMPQSLLQKKIEKIAKNLLKLCPVNLQENFVSPTQETYHKLMFRPKAKVLRMPTKNLLTEE